MNEHDTYRDTLLYALTIAGSEGQLAEHLSVSVLEVQDWLNGVDAVPDRIFQAALDLVVGSSRQAIFRSRRFLQRIAR